MNSKIIVVILIQTLSKLIFANDTNDIDVIMDAAHQGDTRAMCELSKRFLKGNNGVGKSEYMASLWMQKAASNGCVFAIGECYRRGYGVATNLIEAAKWYRKAADNGDADAIRRLGFCYLNGEGLDKNQQEAVRWFQKGVDKGDKKSMGELGILYEKGSGVEKNQQEAVKWYRKAAKEGDDYAMCRLGDCYYKGNGVATNLVEAITWYKKAEENGSTDAMCRLGRHYASDGEDQDFVESMKWYRKAADRGNTLGMRNVGFKYYKGIGVKQSIDEAIEWYSKAAYADDAEAMRLLANCYTTKSPREAVMWYRKSADKGNMLAMNSLGTCYYYGAGVERDYHEAAKWYRMAADKGDDFAMHHMGDCYENGNGVDKNLQEAAKWYQKAADKGNKRAIQSINRIATAIKQENIRLAPAKFNGVDLGNPISDFGEPEKHDNSNDRRFMKKAGEHVLSYWSVRYRPEKVFRGFKVGEIHATWRTKKVYEVIFDCGFDRSATTAADREEIKQTRAALERKYGRSEYSSIDDSDNDFHAYSDDVALCWRLANMTVELKYTSEGRIDRARMKLKAWSPALKSIAEKESLEYFNLRQKEDAASIQAGGEDAL